MDSAVNVQVGAAIRHYRETKLRISQDELAKRLGLSRPSITNIEGGRQQLTVAQLILFANVLGVAPYDLIPYGRPVGPPRALSHTLPKGTDPALKEWADKLMLGHG